MLIYRLHAIALALMLAVSPAAASQSSLSSPTGGTVSGLQLTNNYNAAIDSVNTCNSGGSAPTNQLSGVPSLGNCWWNTSTNAISWYDGANWVNPGWFDTAAHFWQGIIGGGAINNIASATTTDLCSQKPATVGITGVTTITGFGSNCQTGQIKHLVFAAALTLTHNATSLILPNGGSNITTAANDVAEATYLGGGNWRVTDYVLANGQPLNTSAVAVGASSLLQSASGYNQPLNAGLKASIGANALTFTVTDSAGNTPSAATPVLASFNTSSVTAPVSYAALSSALSITIPSSATLGTANGVPFRVWVFLTETGGGTVGVGVAVCSSTTTVFGCAAFEVGANGTAVSAGSTSAGVLYVNGSTTGYRARFLGFADYAGGLSVAGTWNALPSAMYMWGPGMKKPGDVVQTVYFANGTELDSSSSTFASTSLAASITPTSTPNLVAYGVSGGNLRNTGTGSNAAFAQLFRGATGIGPVTSNGGSATVITPVSLSGIDAPATASGLTYTVKLKNSDNATPVNWNFTGAGWSGSGSSITLQEIMGAIEPANDDRPMSAVG